MALNRFAREHRKEPTPAERALWERLRGRRWLGLKFRRQQPLQDFFIADFYCSELRLAVELDGEVHGTPEQSAKDQNRDAALAQLGYTLLRFPNRHVLEDPASVLSAIAEVAERLGKSQAFQKRISRAEG